MKRCMIFFIGIDEGIKVDDKGFARTEDSIKFTSEIGEEYTAPWTSVLFIRWYK